MTNQEEKKIQRKDSPRKKNEIKLKSQMITVDFCLFFFAQRQCGRCGWRPRIPKEKGNRKKTKKAN